MHLLHSPTERRALRHDVTVQCQVVRERDFRLLGEEAVDLSVGGMLLLTRTKVLTGEDVLVTFRAPGIGLWFDTEATVARVIHGRRPGDVGRGLGLEFHRLDRLTRTYLQAGLFSAPPATPKREPKVDYARNIFELLTRN